MNRKRIGAAAAAVVIANGVYVVGPDETAIVQRFGRVIAVTESGLHYKLPWPVDTLTRVSRRARVVELGFRTSADAGLARPVVYEWNAVHRQRKADESLMLTGDQNMAEVTATVHYRVRSAADFLFRHADGEQAVRAAAEAALHAVIASSPLDDALTACRRDLEARAREITQTRLDAWRCGAELLQVRLLDVHPSREPRRGNLWVTASVSELSG